MGGIPDDEMLGMLIVALVVFIVTVGGTFALVDGSYAIASSQHVETRTVTITGKPGYSPDYVPYYDITVNGDETLAIEGLDFQEKVNLVNGSVQRCEISGWHFLGWNPSVKSCVRVSY